MKNHFIVCAAVRKENRVIAGVRHYDGIMRGQMESAEGFKWWRGCEQGFLDNKFNFVSREDAWKIADQAGQIRRTCGGITNNFTPRQANMGDESLLFSEHLY